MIHCRTRQAYEATLERMKEPSVCDEAAMTIDTFVHPPCMEEFLPCCTYKFLETTAIWAMTDASMILVDEEEATRLRTSARRKVSLEQLEEQRGMFHTMKKEHGDGAGRAFAEELRDMRGMRSLSNRYW